MREITAGVSLGALIGLLVGLATSGVVGSVVAGLMAMIGTFFGLQGSETRLLSATPPRITAFSVAAVLAVLVGISMRTNDALTPSLQSSLHAWQDIGFKPETARRIVAFERLGMVPEFWVSPQGSARGKVSTVLYNAKAAGSCGTLTGREYPSGSALAEALIAEKGAWEKLVESAPAELSDGARKRILLAGVALTCGVD